MSGVLAILAGAGTLPRRLREAVQASGRQVVVVAFEGQTDVETTAGVVHLWTRLGAAGRVLEWLRGQGVSDLVFAGPIHRPSWRELCPDWRATAFLAKTGVYALGDDGLLKAIGRGLEEEGFRIVGIHDVLADLLTPPGHLAGPIPDDVACRDIERGTEVVRGVGRLDVGQAAVVQQGLVLGIEAIEGTDALIDRCAGLHRGGPGGVLVKLSKPQQDHRLDLPTVGVTTIERAYAAGLRGVAVEAGRSLLVDAERSCEMAQRLGLFLIGLALETDP